MKLRTSPRFIAADDNRTVLDALTAELAEVGFTPAGTAFDAPAAVVLAAATRPHLALVDVRMPGGGAAAAVGIRSVSSATVVALSAFDHAAARSELREAGAEAYYVKGRDDVVSELIRLAIERGWR